MSDNTAPYTVLARRFRPQTFAEVVGQEHVSQALKNAIESGRVAHAYLFTGARGVGKTSMARILAKTLNCPHAADGSPCNACDICLGISAGSDVDVLEIDGASNRGIDDIRSLRANVGVKSMRTRHKIYIIDEVHMLTKEAFNALLKTLEEPPPGVKFVFCTTEPNKVPDTILSRCQRFDFQSIGQSDIVGRLKQIAEAEGFDVEPAALELVARRAAGSMRDSQSLFDQLLASGEKRISAADVHRLLGTASSERLIEIVDVLQAGDRAAVLARFDALLRDGVQLGELVDQLIHYVRDLMVLAAGADQVELLAVAETERGTLREQAKRWGLPTILAALQILAEAKTRMFRASFARALAEMALVRITLLEDLQSLDELIGVLRQAEQAGGPGSAVSAGRAAAVAASSPAAAPAPAGNRAEKKSADDGEPVVSRTQAETRDVETIELAAGCEPRLLSQLIENVVDTIKSHLRPVRLAISGPNRLELIFPAGYHFSKQYCEKLENIGRLEELATAITGRPVRISLRIESPETQQSSTSEGGPVAPARHASQSVQSVQSVTDPFVKKVQSVFGGAVVRIERLSASQDEG